MASASGSSGRVLIFLLVEGFGREEDGAVERVGEATVAAADLHGDDDEFGDCFELCGEGGVCAGEAEGEADGAVGGDDFEEDGEEAEGVFVCVFETLAFDDGDEEEAQEDEPQIERELATQVVGEVGGVSVVVVFVGPDAEGFLLIYVGLSHRHGDGEDGDVHHDQVANLDGGMELRDVDDGESGGTGGCSLKETREETVTSGNGSDGRVVELYQVSHSEYQIWMEDLHPE